MWLCRTVILALGRQQTGNHLGLCDTTQPHTVTGDMAQWVKCLLYLLGTHVCKSLCHVAHTYSHAVKNKYDKVRKRKEKERDS